MKLNRKHTVGLFTSIAIFSSLMLAVSTRRRSSTTTGRLSTSAGDRHLLGVAPLRGSRWLEEDDPPEIAMAEGGFERFLDWILFLEEGKEHPVWWTDFWAGVGTLLLAALAIVAIIVGVIGGIWVWQRQPLFLLVVPGLPLVALFGHYARDLLWSDRGHKH